MWPLRDHIWFCCRCTIPCRLLPDLCITPSRPFLHSSRSSFPFTWCLGGLAAAQNELLSLDPYRLSDAVAYHVTLDRGKIAGRDLAQVLVIPTLARGAPALLSSRNSTQSDNGHPLVNGVLVQTYDLSCAGLRWSALREARRHGGRARRTIAEALSFFVLTGARRRCRSARPQAANIHIVTRVLMWPSLLTWSRPGPYNVKSATASIKPSDKTFSPVSAPAPPSPPLGTLPPSPPSRNPPRPPPRSFFLGGHRLLSTEPTAASGRAGSEAGGGESQTRNSSFSSVPIDFYYPVDSPGPAPVVLFAGGINVRCPF